MNVSQILPQAVYANYLRESNAFMKDFATRMPADQLAKMRAFNSRPTTEQQANAEKAQRAAFARAMLKGRLAKDVGSNGLTSAAGLNFYDLRGPAYLIYPVNTPFRNSLPREGRVNDGVGTAAHWKATRDFGTVYAGVSEGQRNASAAPTVIDYMAQYKELGIERAATFTSQFAGEGYTDNLADEHLRGMHELWLQEESMMLFGNAGAAGSAGGFDLGTMNTPVAALVEGGAVTTARYVSGYCIAITALGYPNNAQYGYVPRPTVANGLQAQYTRTNADGSQDTINAGTSLISAVSNSVLTTGTTLQVSFTATPVVGAFAYAWYLAIKSADSMVIGDHHLVAITTIPYYLMAANPTTSTQAANATAVTGFGTDHSMQTRDFNGLLTYAAAVGRWVDMVGASLTSDGANGITQIDADLQYFWDNFQAVPNAIWCAADAKVFIDQTIMANGGNPGAFRFEYARDGQNNILGGAVVSAYQSKFAMSQLGGQAIPLRIHPMLPAGCIYYDIADNPYPSSRIPFVRGMLTQRDYYSIEWPLQTRTWTFGTYVHETLAHHVPWICGVRAGIGGADT